MARAASLLLASTLLLPGGSHAQESGKSVRGSAQAVLVEVPVRVVDKGGKPIHGLTASDFELFDEGARQTLEAVDVVDLAAKGAQPPQPGEDVAPAARRRFLLLFDLSFSEQKAVLAAQRAAKEFVLAGMGDHDLAAVATFSLQQGLRLCATFSSDRVQLARAIETLGTPAKESLKSDPLAFVYDVNRLAVEYGGSKKQAVVGAIIETTETFKALERASVDRFSRGRITQLTGSLSSLALALDAVDGRKDVIFLSEGFESRLIVGTKDTDQEKEWITQGEIWKIDSDKRFGSTSLQRQFSELSTLFKRSDCVMHAVDIHGIATQGAIGENESVGASENSLFELVNETGGSVFRNTNDFKTQLDALLTKTSLVYVLFFRPQLSGKDGKFHELKVKVKTPGARVSARAGYYESRSFRTLSPLERSLSAANVITQEKAKGDIALAVMALPFAEEKLSRVPVLVAVPPEALDAAPAKGPVQLGLYVYVTDEKGELADYFTRLVNIDPATEAGAQARSGLTYYGTCRLPSGRYRIRAYVRNEQSGRFGFRVVPLEIPEIREGTMTALPPIFVSRAGSGLRLKDEAAGADRSPEPFLVGQTLVVPQVLPSVSAGAPSRVCLMVYQKAHTDVIQPLEIRVQIVDAAGAVTMPAKVSMVSRTKPAAMGLDKMILEFEPPTLPPGEYSLRVTFKDVADESSHTESEARFRVL